jgi:branched-chain amino acid transport system permease protein
MEILGNFFVTPFVEIADSPVFFAEVVLNGLLTGVMYSLVALGFVLIFKASGVFNFAQGIMVLFAALTLVGLMDLGVPLILALLLTVGVMVALAFAVEKLMLRHLVNQEGIILFMATIGLTFFLEGFGEMIWGSNVKRLDIGIPDRPIEFGGILLSSFDMVAAATGAVLVAGLAIFFQKTSIGRALRAVADDHQAALSVGIPLKTIWIVVWSVSGIVALVAGIMWGSKSGVQFSLSLIALKALPVLGLLGPGLRWRHRKLVRLHARHDVPAVPAAGVVRRAHHRTRIDGERECFIARPGNSRPLIPRTNRCSQ